MANGSTPEATELVYVPDPSWMPAIAALGFAGILAGIFVWFPYGVVGAVLAIVAIVSMFRRAGDDMERLPRRQHVTTAVLPPVAPRKPGA
jgi:hypothetical protein